MAPFVAKLSDQDMQDLAMYYAGQRPAPAAGPSDPAKAVVGERLATELHCNACHRPDLSGQNQVPRITGLTYDYALTQLRGYKAQTRADTDLAMTMAAQTLTEPVMDALAHYLASLPRR
jgi:cytochrome c553